MVESVEKEPLQHFIIVDLQQGTGEWLEWRNNGIGASDAATVMGENPFKTADCLLQEKRMPIRHSGRDDGSAGSSAMARGTQLEPEARRRYIATTGIHMEPICLQSTRFDWLRASLDGFSLNHDAVIEIKCGNAVYMKVSRTGLIPDYYYGQTQHILAVTGLKSLDFWCYWPGFPELLVPIPRNDEYIERMLVKEQEFWNKVQAEG